MPVSKDFEQRIGGTVDLKMSSEASSRIFFHPVANIRGGTHPAFDQARCPREIISFHVSRFIRSDFAPDVYLIRDKDGSPTSERLDDRDAEIFLMRRQD